VWFKTYKLINLFDTEYVYPRIQRIYKEHGRNQIGWTVKNLFKAFVDTACGEVHCSLKKKELSSSVLDLDLIFAGSVWCHTEYVGPVSQKIQDIECSP
jgi:hypothetical protein